MLVEANLTGGGRRQRPDQQSQRPYLAGSLVRARGEGLQILRLATEGYRNLLHATVTNYAERDLCIGPEVGEHCAPVLILLE